MKPPPAVSAPAPATTRPRHRRARRSHAGASGGQPTLAREVPAPYAAQAPAAVGTVPDTVDLSGLAGQIEALGQVDFDRVHPDSLGELVGGLTRLGDQLAAVRTRVLAAFDARRAYRGDGKRSSADWMAETLHVDKRAARREARLAQTLPALPAVAAAYEAGEISADHASVIARTIDDPSTPQGRQAEASLLAAARELSPAQLAREARRRRIQDQPDDAAEVARQQWAGRSASRIELESGMVRWEIVSDPASAEYLDAAVARLSAPDPKDLPDDQRRSFLQRRHDAFVTLAKTALDRDELPAKHGPSTTGLVLIDHDTLVDGDGDGRLAAELGINGPIDATTARAMLCDAGVARVLVDGKSQVLDLGRTTRTCSDAQRAAVYARDRACRRCGASLALCEVHHIIGWEDGGPTDLANLIALCWSCHRELHLAGWKITLHPDLSATFTLRDGRTITRPPPRRPR